MSDSSRIAELKRRVQMDPASIAFAALAEEYRRLGRYEESVATCQVGLLRHPAYLSARVTLGRSLIELKRYDEAREQLEHVLRVAPENLAAIRGLAEIHGYQSELTSVPETSGPVRPAPAAAGGTSGTPPQQATEIEPGAQPKPPEPESAAVRSLHLAPIRPVRLSRVADEGGPAAHPIMEPESPPGDATSAGEPALPEKRTSGTGLRLVTPRAAPESAPTPPADDDVVLKLEAFLAAILRVRQSAAGGHPVQP
jgi:tetratricopeptide (TPR) repeat protein